MTLLVISPDYASHVLPLATLATAWRDAGDEVVVATGPATAPVVEGFGYGRADLRLGRGSNPGVIRPEEQVRGEDEALRGFFEATRRGMVETLRFQADARSTDLLWEPVATARAVLDVLEDVRPDHVVVDHLAFSARLALQAGGVPHADVVLGHPCALPVGDEVYGYPTAWPRAFAPDPEALAALHTRCREVRDRFTGRWNDALALLAPEAPAVDDAFTQHGDVLLLNYTAALHPPTRTARLPLHAFLGSSVRSEQAPDDIAAWLADDDDRPLVLVAFGSFLSARGDVLGKVVDALSRLDVRVALATGSADTGSWGPLPSSWLVRGYLPQVAILAHADAVVSHAGNNTVTEALTFGVPVVALPFSTDQFAGAAAVEATGVGLALDPNAATPADVGAAVRRVLDGDAHAAATRLGDQLRAAPGPQRARAAITPHGASAR